MDIHKYLVCSVLKQLTTGAWVLGPCEVAGYQSCSLSLNIYTELTQTKGLYNWHGPAAGV